MKRLIHQFRRDQSANVLMITGLSFLFLVAIGGAAYDLGKQQLVRQKIQQATDAAALAGASRENVDDTTRISTANAFFTLNYPDDYLGVGRPDPKISVAAGQSVSVSATSTVQTSFVRALDIDTLPANGASQVQIGTAQAKLDVVLVLDNSGSMGSSFDVGEVNSLNADPGVRPYCLAGSAEAIRRLWKEWWNFTPTQAQLDAAALNSCNTNEGATGYNRLNALRYSASAFIDQLLSPNPLDHQVALITWDDYLIDAKPFSKDAAALKKFLSLMYGRRATNSSVGLNEALAMSSNFRSDTTRAIILMTDGKNQIVGTPDGNPRTDEYNAASLQVCSQLKTTPRTLVFAIAFGKDVVNEASVKQFLSDCATGPNGTADPKPNENLYFYAAPDADSLKKVFDDIIGRLNTVRILK